MTQVHEAEASPARWRAAIAKVIDSITVYPDHWEILDTTGRVTAFPR